MTPKKRKRTKRVSGVLGVGLDATDGIKRITTTESMTVVGGSADTHERMQETAIKFNEALEKKGRTLPELSVKQAAELLREAIRESLPRQVFDRPKTGFSLPVDAWMRGGIHDTCEAAMESLAACPLFEAAAVRKVWQDLHDPRVENHWSRRIALVVLGSYLAGAARASSSS